MQETERGNRAHYSGIQLCGDVWGCPHCSAIIRARRAIEIQNAIFEHMSNGGGILLVTQTLRHHQGDDLELMLDVLTKAQRRMVSSRWWTKVKKRFGVIGYVRTIEITHGRNGWHPHFHFVYFLARPISQDEAGMLQAEMFGRWAGNVEFFGGKMPNEHGVDVKSVEGIEAAGAIAHYVGKPAEEKAAVSVSSEVARGDMKSSDGGITPFELLDSNDEKSLRLWDAYVKATKGRRAFYWSNGLRKALGLDVEATDEEIMDESQNVGESVVHIPAKVYSERVKPFPDVAAAILESVESGDLAAVAEMLGCRQENRDVFNVDTGELLSREIHLAA